MKKQILKSTFFVFLFVVAIAFTSCKKETTEVETVESTEIEEYPEDVTVTEEDSITTVTDSTTEITRETKKITTKEQVP